MNKGLSILFLLFGLFDAGSSVYAAWVQKAPFGGTAKHRCTAFSVGNKGYIGGGHTNSGTVAYFKDYWEYDPGTNSWTQIADFGGGYRYHATGFGVGNYGYVGLGEDENGNYTTDFWKYIPLINTWVQVTDFPGAARRGACSFVIDGKAYVGTGQVDAGYENDFYVYDPLMNSWNSISDFTGEARSSAVAFAYDGKGYVGTGHVLGNDTNDFYSYDPISNSWSQRADVGDLPRQDATGFVVQGEGYIGTGNNVEGTDNFGDFWKYNFSTDEWVQVADFDGQARRYLVSFVIGDVAYCGTGTNGTNLRDFWAFYPLLGMEDINPSVAVSVYPNPSPDGFIQIEIGKVGLENALELIILDSQGKVVLQKLTEHNEILLNMSEFGSGTYFYLIYENNRQAFSGKFNLIL